MTLALALPADDDDVRPDGGSDLYYLLGTGFVLSLTTTVTLGANLSGLPPPATAVLASLSMAGAVALVLQETWGFVQDEPDHDDDNDDDDEFSDTVDDGPADNRVSDTIAARVRARHARRGSVSSSS